MYAATPTYVCMYCLELTLYIISYWPIGATVSLIGSNYSVAENNGSVVGNIILSSEASEDVIVEVTISDGSANGNVE